MVETGITDEIEVKEKSGGTTVITDKFGRLVGGSFTHRQDLNEAYSIGQGPNAQALIPMVTETQGSITCHPHDLRFLQVFGSESTGSGTFTVTFDDTLPTYTIKMETVDGGGTTTLETFKFGGFRLEVRRGEELEVELNGMAKDFKQDDTETISTEAIGGDPRQFFDATLKIGGTAVGTVDSMTVDFSRNLQSFKGIEDDTGAAKRKPSEIIERLFDIQFDAAIVIEDQTAWKEALDDSSNPYEVQETLSEQDVELDVDTSAGTSTLNLKNSVFSEITHEKADDAEIRTAALSGTARDIEATGDT